MASSRLSATRPSMFYSSILGRQLTQAFILTGFIVLLLTTLTFFVTRTIIEQSVTAQISSVAAVSEDTLEQVLQTYRERGTLVTAHATIREILLPPVSPGLLARLFEQLRRDESSLAGIEVYSTDGRVLESKGVRIDPFDAHALLSPQYRSVADATGWHWYDVWTPVWGNNGEIIGYIAMRYDVYPLLERLTTITSSLRLGAQIAFVHLENNDLQLLYPAQESHAAYMLSIGSASQENMYTMPWLSAAQGDEGAVHSTNEKGSDVLVGFRYLPTLGWGMVLTVDRDAALSGVRKLAITHAFIGTLLLLLSAVLAWMLARQLTAPLLSLTKRVQGLQEGAWSLRRSVHTGDEVEVLESVLVDLTNRLQNLYRSQEHDIRLRTDELRRQYTLDRAILDTIEYGVITVNRTGHITAINAAGLRLLLQKNENILGMSVEEIVHICDNQGEKIKDEHPLVHCMKTGHIKKAHLNAHLHIRRRNNSLLPVLYTVSPLGTTSKISGAVMVFQDSTDERKVDYLKSEFISLASHQLRTPLAALRWYTELLSESKKDLHKDQREYIHQMKESVERMDALLSSLLRASKMETQTIQPDIQDTNITAVIHEMNTDFLPLAQEAGVKCEFSSTRASIHLRTDPTLFRIVLQNLLSNAIKYSVKHSEKAVEIEVSETDRRVLVTVRDEGVGIPALEQSRIFQKFFRAKNVRKMDTNGNGLGMYITKTIVECLGGKISFKSTENKGTTFTVSFPKMEKKK